MKDSTQKEIKQGCSAAVWNRLLLECLNFLTGNTSVYRFVAGWDLLLDSSALCAALAEVSCERLETLLLGQMKNALR